MFFRVVTRIIKIFVCFDVFVEVVRFNFNKKAVGICVQKLALWSVLLFKFVVEKVVHQYLAVVKDSHPRVDRFVKQQPAFVHANSDKVI